MTDTAEQTEKPTETVPPDQDVKAKLRRVREGFDLGVDHEYTLVVEPWEVIGCAALQGLTFRFGNSFVHPRARDSLAEVKKLVDEKGKEGKLVAFGHTDKVGSDAANKALSERRAKSVVALIQRDPDVWASIDQEESWKLDVVQTCLLEVGYRPGPVDGKDGPKTQAAVKAFQGDHGLQVDGKAGPDTRKKLYEEYQRRFETGIPADAFMDPAALGVGEKVPIVETEEECETNRRVSFFMFRAKRLPKLPDLHDDQGEWYRKIADDCACGDPPIETTPLVLKAEDGKRNGAPLVEEVTLKICAGNNGAAPVGMGLGGKVELLAVAEPPTPGTFTWECPSGGAKLEPQGERVVVTAENESEDVPITCKLVTTAGNSFTAEHTLRWNVLVRVFDQNGKRQSGAPRGTGEDEDQQSYIHYGGQTLASIDDIHQDQGDGDCGPTCAAFFRFGGRLCTGAPQENGKAIAGSTIQAMGEKMRADTGANADHRVGTTAQEMIAVLREFAGAWDKRKTDWDTQRESYDVSTAGAVDLAILSFAGRMNRLLQSSPRGVLTGVLSFAGGKPFREALREAQQAKRQLSGTQHWVVCTKIDGDHTEFYDPGFGQSGRRTFETRDFFAAHIEWSKSPMDPVTAVGSQLVVNKPPEGIFRLLKDTTLCQLDAGIFTNGQNIVAKVDAEWYVNADEADARGRALAGSGSAVVVELPDGNFGVVSINDVSDSNARSAEVDRGEGGALVQLQGAISSLRFFLRVDGQVHERTVRFRGTHR
ncbi:MAG: peptidoglycan-binding protein [Planctomycetota bacterium]